MTFDIGFPVNETKILSWKLNMENIGERLSTIILAAGKGKRMKSDLAKVLHPLRGKPMLTYPVDIAQAVQSEKVVVVIGHQAEEVKKAFKNKGLIFVEQREQLGTGHAVLQAADVLKHHKGTVLILCGDVPLLKVSTVYALIDCHMMQKSVITVLTTVLNNPFGYGRVIKNETGDVLQIVEEKDAVARQKQIKEINTGIYCMQSPFLFDAVAALDSENAQNEYYLTDIVKIANQKNFKVSSFVADDPMEVMGINTAEDLQRAQQFLKKAMG
jgi:UDP-N-acetylglucosamine diphosphorylase/glucosamine-1-phosphate N-acetyltransferase